MFIYKYFSKRNINPFFYLVPLVFLVVSCSNSSNESKQNATHVAEVDSYSVPQKTILATLPDSAQVKTILLADQEKLIHTNIPRNGASARAAVNMDGKAQQILVESPITKPLSYTKNGQGQINLDRNGKPFILGNGGRASFKQFTSETGLAMDVVVCAFTDASGNIWFGTLGGGISKYDGKSFTNYSTAHGLPNNQIYGITQDKSGRMWIATLGGGISCFNGKNFTTYKTEQGLASDFVNCILVDKNGLIWSGTRDGKVSSFNGKKFTNYNLAKLPGDDVINSIYEDLNGNLWFGAEISGLHRFDGKQFKNYTTTQGLAGNVVRCIKGDSKGNIWIGTFDNGISCIPAQQNNQAGKAIIFKNYSSQDGLSENDVFSMHVDHLDRVWFGTDGGGVNCLNPESIADSSKGRLFTCYNSELGLANNSVFGITEDLNGHIWLCTYGGGVVRFDGEAFTVFSEKQGLAANNIICINQDKSGNLWLGSIGKGASCFDGKSFTNYSPIQGLAGSVVTCMMNDRNGNMWLGTDNGGAVLYDGKSFTSYTVAHGLSSNYIISLYQDRSGAIWIGTVGGGVCRFDGNSFTSYSTPQGLAGDMVMSILEDKSGKMWFSCYGQGISCFDGNSITTYTTNQGLGFNTAFCMREDAQGNIWCGTDGMGISVLMNDKINSKLAENRFKSITVKDGISDNTVTQILFLKNKKVAVGTNSGITLFNYPDLSKPINLTELEIFNTTNGFPVKDVNVGQNCMFEDRDGIIWLGTGSDKSPLLRFDYAALLRNKRKPEIAVQSIKINDHIISWNNLPSGKQEKIDSLQISARLTEEIHLFKRELTQSERDTLVSKFGNIHFSGIQEKYPLPEKLVLPYKHNNITFDYAAIEPSNPSLITYQYKLEGYDEDWNPITTKTSATFGNIYEGNYTFKLKARFTGIADSLGGSWTEPVEYSFEVLPPWYRTWWAYFLYLVGTGTLILLLFRWRTSALRRDKLKLEQTVRDRTAELVIQNKTVEEKNREILDSIEYAKRIQATILPSVRVVKKYLQDSFILYIPKDIVAGDFYWMESPEDSNTVFFAACDCTGHGVPGAMVSVICHNALNKSLKEFGMRTPSKILDKVGELVIEDFNKNIDIEGEIQDGMDASVCSLDTETGKLEWAGANNPLWLIRNGSALQEIKPDKQPVGQSEDRQPYTNHQFELKKGDVIYLITDGYADQFGGARNKKFQKSRLRELVFNLHQLPMEEQRTKLYDAFIQWKG
ncbi:MAG TPA: two-component regulator propeller domain-containing protein, partial [Flavobacteriales bacterium]|nr:two-component regulator propeller domain-containing protein [Flavobacteriales bacterium]